METQRTHELPDEERLDELLSTLAKGDRRRLVGYLNTVSNPVSVSNIARTLTESDSANDETGTPVFEIELRQIHLPKLEHAGLLRHDTETDRVERIDDTATYHLLDRLEIVFAEVPKGGISGGS